MKNEKTAWFDAIIAGMLIYEGDCVKEWMWKVCKEAFISGSVPSD